MTQVLCIPLSPVLADFPRNRAALIALAEAIAAAPVQPDVIVLPELALSGYLLESLSGEAAIRYEDFAELAEALAATGVQPATEWIVSAPLRERHLVYNAAAVLAGGKVKHIHRKLFLPTYGMFDEARYFDRGTEFSVYDGKLGKTGILICEDAWHPELAHLASVAGAESVIVISASPARGVDAGDEFSSSRHWRHRLQAFAEVYGQTYIYCNRAGVEDGVLYDAISFVYNSDAVAVSGDAFAAAEHARLYAVPTYASLRPGFAGDASRQGDARLIHDLLQQMLLRQQ